MPLLGKTKQIEQCNIPFALCITFLLHINLQSYIHLKMKYFSVCPIQYCNGHNNKQYEALSNLQSVMQPYALVADTNAAVPESFAF